MTLAFDTATSRPSAALGRGRDILAEIALDPASRHSQRLLPGIDGLLRSTGTALVDVGAIAVTRGPGSFTGVRVGLATALGLSESLALPARGWSTLEVLALSYPQPSSVGITGGEDAERVAAVINARRGEYYLQGFTIAGGFAEALGPPLACLAGEVLNWLEAWGITHVTGLEPEEPLCETLRGKGKKIVPAPLLAATLVARQLHHANASGARKAPDAEALAPLYVRASEAERRGF